MPAELSLTWSQVLAWRLARSFLTKPAARDATEVAERLIGVQAQVMSSAEVAISLRARGVQPADVARALWEDRSLVKTWTARGTLHLVTPPDLALWCAAMRARGEYWDKPSWARYHGVTGDEMRTLLAGMDEALTGRCLTRQELADSLGGVTEHPELAARVMSSWGATIKPAAFHAKLCFGPNRGRNVTFVSPADWLGAWKPADSDEALAVLARRYVATYGPSIRDDVTRWMGVEPKVGRRAFQSVVDELVEVDVEGQSAWMAPADAKRAVRTEPRGIVRLLPAFDPYVVGVLRHLDRVVPEPSLRCEVSRKAGWISPTIVVDGRIVGLWRHDRRGRSVQITLSPFASLGSEASAAAEREVASMERLLARLPEEDTAGDSSSDL